MKKTRKTAIALIAAAVMMLALAFAACGRTVTGLEVTTAPTKIEYIEGQKFDPAGMVITAIYGEEKEEVTEYTYEPMGELKTTDTKITVTYEGQTVTQQISVAAKAVPSLEIAAEPNKTEYTAGETFDKTGLKVSATYNDGTTAEITDYKLKPSRALCANDQKVTVSVGEASVEIPVTVAADPDAFDPVPVYRAVGSIELAEQKANINFTFYNDYMLRGLLESGMGATVDNMLGKFLDFPGVWDKNGEDFWLTLNTYIFDPQSLKGLAGFVPDDMKDMFDMLLGMEAFEITGCTSIVTLGENNTITFDATISAMGFAAPVKGEGHGAPEKTEVKAGEHAEAEWGDYSKMKSQSASSAMLKDDAKMSGGNYLQYCGTVGNVWKMTVNSAEQVSGATMKLCMLAYKKGYDLGQYIALKVNGVEVSVTGELSSISKFVEFETSVDLKKGDNVIEITWKELPKNEAGAEQKITNVKFDYISFSSDVTVVNPALV